MAKDSYWFRHDSSAGRAPKMRKMAHFYEHWGKGVYWDVIEVLRDQDGYQFEADDTSLQMLMSLIGCIHEKKFFNWFKDCIRFGLLEHTNEEKTHFFCPPLSQNMVRWEASKSNGKKGGNPNFIKGKSNPYYEEDKGKDNLEDNPIDKGGHNLKDNHKRREEKITEDKKEVHSLEDILEYAKELSLKDNKDEQHVTRLFERAFEHYEGAGWKNAQGKPVKNLKSTIRNNWYEKELANIPPRKKTKEEIDKSYNFFPDGTAR